MAISDIRTASSTALDAGATKVLRNTYALLAMTLLFSALTAGVSMALNVPYLGLWTLLPYFVLLFLVEKNKNSAAGLLCVFALTGWMGFSLGPILNHYVGISGFEPVLTALGGTAAIFFGLSAFVLVTRKDFSFATGFLGTGMLVAFVAAIANYFLHIQALSLVDHLRVHVPVRGLDHVADQPDHPRRRAQLHLRDRDAVRDDLQPVLDPAQLPRRRQR